MNPPQGLVSNQSNHATFECPHCAILTIHNKIQVTPGFTETQVESTRPGSVAFFHAQHQHYILRCVNCKKDTYFFYRPDFMNSGNTRPQFPKAELLHQYPISTPVSHSAVPEPVTSAAIEAEKCLGVRAYNACGVMTRRAIHSLCGDKGAEGRDLFGQLKDLKSKQLITPDLHEWADSLRVLGRDGAHPEFPEVTADDAEDGVKLLREIINYVYILPHDRAERRKSR
jgi:hypothetical protein